MGIETTRILDEIDKHTARARGSEPEKIRESLAAIRALCDLLLEDGMQAPKKPRAMPLAATETVNRPQSVPAATRLQEEGANGDSLFEF
ncbi:MAG: YwdI family protein [Planococcus sp. (in: firmicutes)]|uniref:YwdI family protein n=1 Tax=Planococcus alpniumensis TaxID=2708345 RepID=UPI001B8CEAFF|nr:YwdI family protein [Planococcus sp. MSAK28401]MDN5708850.1 YwdI family protein [Planococcus sp. (in: firmicutes)]